MKKTLSFAVFLIFLCSFLSASCKNNQKSDFLDVKINSPNRNFKRHEDKNIVIVLTNNGNNAITIPEWLTQGFSDDRLAELHIEIMEKGKESQEYKDLPYKDIDYDYFTFERKNKVIQPSNEFEYNIELDLLYNLQEIGQYKVRGILQLPGYKEIETSWVNFSVE